MPKRKSDSCTPSVCPSITSLDAALDILACETFTRIHHLASKFEAAAGVKLNDGVITARWEEAVRRFWVMKGMDDLCCSTARALGAQTPRESEADGEEKMDDKADSSDERRDTGGRLLPSSLHPGAPVVHSLNPEEELEWRRWTPRVGDSVLVELSDDGIWPGKVIDKKVFFQGRTVPRGNHFFAVRLYCDDMQPTVTIKSRLLPLRIRPNPPLLATTQVLSAYNHAANPASFDEKEEARESLDAHRRSHPGVGAELDQAKVRAERVSWNELINWVMSERRVEKLRALDEERNKRLRQVSKGDDLLKGLVKPQCEKDDLCPKKRRMSATIPLPLAENGRDKSRSASPSASTIFGPLASVPTPTPRRTSSPSLAGFIRPALSTPQRPMSPRRFADKRRAVYTGIGEYSPRGRGGTYTPPRILPSGDETAPQRTGSPAPSLHKFDFVSPLGPAKLGRYESEERTSQLGRKASLEAVKEEPQEGDEDGWTVVQSRSPRGGSMPCREKAKGITEVRSDGMTVDA